LVLAYESLDGEDLRRADEYLSENPSALVLLRRLQEIEAAAADPVPATDSWPVTELTADEDAAQLASLTELIASLNLDIPEVRPVSWWRRRALYRPGLLLPAAAVIALAAVLPRALSDKIIVQDLSVVTLSQPAESYRGGEARPEPGVLRSGERFRLRFTLNEDAHILVVHVDSAGTAAIVHPADITRPLALMSKGSHVVPNPSEDRTWALDRNTGMESFIVVASPTADFDIDSLLAELATVSASTIDRGDMIDALAKRLEAFGSTQLIEFEHRN